MTRRRPPLDRLRERTVVDATGCHLFTGALYANGYGAFRFDGRTRAAHRVAYELQRGPIPDGLVLDHLCRVRNCINPDHLEVVTNAENKARGESLWAKNARKTHCPKGHPLSAENLLRRHYGRECRTCHNERCKRRYWKKRQGIPRKRKMKSNVVVPPEFRELPPATYLPFDARSCV
jgi:HNH endonuclease